VLGLVLQPGERLDDVGAELRRGHGREVLEQADDVGEALVARRLANLRETGFDAVPSQVRRPAQRFVFGGYLAFALALPAGAPSCGQ
jgi:hypothetical protein